MSIYQLHKAIFINQSAGACFMTLYVTAAWPSLFESRQVCSIHKITPSDWVLLRYDVVATYLSIVVWYLKDLLCVDFPYCTSFCYYG